MPVSTIGTTTQVAFNFRVTGQVVITGICLASSLGLSGVTLPCVSAARLPITRALPAR